MKTETPVSLRIMEVLGKERGDGLGFKTVMRGKSVYADFKKAYDEAFAIAQMVKFCYGPIIFIEETGQPATFERAEQLQRLHAAVERVIQRDLNPAEQKIARAKHKSNKARPFKKGRAFCG